MDGFSGVVAYSMGPNPSWDLVMEALKSYIQQFGIPKAVSIPESDELLENLCERSGIEIRIKSESHDGLADFFDRLEREAISGLPGTCS